MTNISRLCKHIVKFGESNIIINTIPKSHHWLVAQKVLNHKWRLIIMDPNAEVGHLIGKVQDKTYEDIIDKLTFNQIAMIRQSRIKRELLSINM